MYWVVSAAALVGVVLNIRKHVACFYIWASTNAIWVYADWNHGLPAQATLQALYCALSIWGICAWSADRRVR
jgi:nicotinamide riboside transporter PnuC